MVKGIGAAVVCSYNLLVKGRQNPPSAKSSRRNQRGGEFKLLKKSLVEGFGI